MSIETSRRRGRLSRTAQAAVRGKIWMAAVLPGAAKAAVQIEEQFELQFVGSEGGSGVRQRKWDRYSAGEHDRSDEFATEPIALAEGARPRKAAWCRRHLWRTRPGSLRASKRSETSGVSWTR